LAQTPDSEPPFLNTKLPLVRYAAASLPPEESRPIWSPNLVPCPKYSFPADVRRPGSLVYIVPARPPGPVLLVSQPGFTRLLMLNRL